MSEESTSIVATTETSALAAVVVEALEERLLMAYLAELDLRPRSRETYAKALRRFFAWTHESGRAFTQLSRADVLAYKEQALRTSALPPWPPTSPPCAASFPTCTPNTTRRT